MNNRRLFSTLGLVSLLVILFFSTVLAETKSGKEGAVEPPLKKDKTLFTMADWSITEEDLQRRIDNLPPDQRGQFKTEEQRKIMLKNLVGNHLLAVEARQAGFDQTEPWKTSLEDMNDFYLANAYINTKLSDSKIPDQEIETYYSAHGTDFRKPAMVSAKHILIRVDLNAPLKDVQTALEKINGIKTELDHGADFALLAEKYSEDSASSKRGGEIGFVTRDELHPDVAAVTFNLPVGKYSQPVRSVFGYHIILAADRKEERPMTLKEATPQIRNILFKNKQQQAVAKEIERLKKKYSTE